VDVQVHHLISLGGCNDVISMWGVSGVVYCRGGKDWVILCLHYVLKCGMCTVQVVKGGDVVHAIERVKTDRNDKPVDDIKIINVEVKASVE
jgi:hypothetical protein